MTGVYAQMDGRIGWGCTGCNKEGGTVAQVGAEGGPPPQVESGPCQTFAQRTLGWASLNNMQNNSRKSN